MNAPENIATINAAHGVLLNAKDALSVTQVAAAIGASKPTAQKQLKELYGLGLIESEPRAGGTPFYRLIAEPEKAEVQRGEIPLVEQNQEVGLCQKCHGTGFLPRAMSLPEPLDVPCPNGCAPLSFATSPELQHLAPEDYEMPAADPALLALANRELAEQLEEKDAELLSQAQVVVDLRRLVAELDEQVSSLTTDVTQTRTALNHAINEADRLRRELTDAVDVADAAVGYLVKAPKLKPRRVTKPEGARAAALAAVRAGAARAEVFALVPVGTARRGAEWQGIKPTGKGD